MTTQNAVRPRSSNKRNRNLLKFENKSRISVHTFTTFVVGYHYVLDQVLSTSITFSLRPQYDHTIRTTTLVRSCHVYIASVPHKTYPAKYSHFCWYFLIEICHPEVAVEEQNWELEGERVTSLRMKLSRQSRNHQKAHNQRATQKKFQMNYKVMIQTPALKKLSIQKQKKSKLVLDLSPEEEQDMVEWFESNPILYNRKLSSWER